MPIVDALLLSYVSLGRMILNLGPKKIGSSQRYEEDEDGPISVTRTVFPEYGSRFPSTDPGSQVRVQVPKYGSRFSSTVMGWPNISDSYGI